MEVFADGRAPKPVMTPLTMVGRSISRPGTWAAMSSSPTLLRVPDFSSVMPRPPLAPVLARTSLRSSLAHVFGWSCLDPPLAPVLARTSLRSSLAHVFGWSCLDPPLAPVLARTSLRSSLAHVFGWSCLGPSPFRLSQTLVIAITAWCTRLHRHLDVVDDDQPLEGRLSDVAGVRKPVQPGQQAVVVPDRVEHHHRLVMHAEVARSPGFEELLEGADAAGQRDERVGAVLHDLLALAHRVGNDELVGFVVRRPP